jgi:hypothetical protein
MSRIMPRILCFVAAAFFLLAIPSRADSLTYNFIYAGTQTYPDGTGGTVAGNGSFTVSYTPGLTAGTLTAFTFSDTFTSSGYGDSTFTYTGLTDVASSSLLVSPTSPYGVTNVTIKTDYLTGTNSGYGPVDFVLNFSGVTADSTGGSNALASDYYGGFSSGGGTLSVMPVSATPEPGTIYLLATAGLLGGGLLWRRRGLQGKGTQLAG